MFDCPHSFEPFINSEQAAALVKVHPKTLQRLARNGRVIGYRVGKLWRFRASDLDGWSQDSEQIEIDSQAERSYSVLNHSCPQPNRRYGSIRLRKRERGPDVWEFRYSETDSQGKRKRQSVILGDRNLYATETQARKATQALRLGLNGESPRAEVETASFGALLDRYIEQELSERYSTRKSHLSNIRVNIRPRWGEYPVDKLKPMAMEQ